MARVSTSALRGLPEAVADDETVPTTVLEFAEEVLGD